MTSTESAYEIRNHGGALLAWASTRSRAEAVAAEIDPDFTHADRLEDSDVLIREVEYDTRKHTGDLDRSAD